MSHDQLGKILNTTRQAIISWEKNGVEPRAPMRKKLAKFSGFQAACFSRREAEELAQDTFGRRLERAEETLERVLQGMVEAGIPIPRAAAEHQSSATVRPKRKTA
jgi:DNA-binding transcriptional regulator YiaG